MFRRMKLDNEVEKMIEDIQKEVLYTRSFINKDNFDERIMKAMRQVPRHEFVPEEQRPMAYFNGPLTIGHGQTISQPYIVALMTDLLNIDENSVVLEVGTGSGYQAAILAQLVKKVYSIELIPELLQAAQVRFARLEYTNIETCIADGHEGWAEHAPYDGIIVTAAAVEIPQALVDQLRPGGRLVIPVGHPYGDQELILLEKNERGETTQHNILAVAFVPLVRVGKPH